MDTERIKGIFKEKYGVEHPAQFEKFNNKIKETKKDMDINVYYHQ
jgi:hypothetical protein